MATQIINSGSGVANSADIVVTAGAPVTVMLNDAAGPDLPEGCQVDIYLKDAANEYFVIGALQSRPAERRATTLTGPGTYRLTRTAGSAPCGVCTA